MLVLTLLASLALPTWAGRAGQESDAPDPLPSDPVFEATLADGSTLRGRIRSLSADGLLEMIGEDQGDAHRIEPGALVKLSRARLSPTGSAPDAPLVILPEGDQIRGQIDSADEQEIALRSPILGELTIPLEVVLGFSITPARETQAESQIIRQLRGGDRDTDRLFLSNGDARDVTFTDLGESEIRYLDADRAMKLPRELVVAVGLDPGLVQRPEPPARSFDLVLIDGTRLRVAEPDIRGGRISGQTTFGVTIEAPLDRVAECYSLGEAIVYLSDVEPTREVTVPYVGPTRPARANASVLGDPITVGGRRVVRGLGTQSRSLLAFPLGPRDRRFQASVALDDIAGPLGNVVFRVLVDGEERFASPPVASGDPPIAIDVDVSGGQFLILATEFGQGGGIQDFGAWIDPRLIRTSPDDDDDPGPAAAGN